MPDHSIPYYSGERLPQEFSEWLSTIPKGYEWYANDLGKDQSTYTFYKVDADDQLNCLAMPYYSLVYPYQGV